MKFSGSENVRDLYLTKFKFLISLRESSRNITGSFFLFFDDVDNVQPMFLHK